jgi:hypothetical protein
MQEANERIPRFFPHALLLATAGATLLLLPFFRCRVVLGSFATAWQVL